MDDSTAGPQDGGTVSHAADTRFGTWSASKTPIAPRAFYNRRRRWHCSAAISGWHQAIPPSLR